MARITPEKEGASRFVQLLVHFSMMSLPFARRPNAKVNQCYLCHRTTSWNGIKGVAKPSIINRG